MEINAQKFLSYLSSYITDRWLNKSPSASTELQTTKLHCAEKWCDGKHCSLTAMTSRIWVHQLAGASVSMFSHTGQKTFPLLMGVKGCLSLCALALLNWQHVQVVPASHSMIAGTGSSNHQSGRKWMDKNPVATMIVQSFNDHCCSVSLVLIYDTFGHTTDPFYSTCCFGMRYCYNVQWVFL